jgi:signal transduction histidine kinase
MRTLLLELRPAALAETPFVELIDQLGDALRSRKAIKVRVDAPPAPDLPELPPAEKHAFYRIAQESLHNVGRHAFASEVVVAVSIVDNEFSMLISDDGEGFAVGNPKADRLGLTIMQERAHAVGARFTVSSTPGVGTEVAVRLPVGAS